LSGEVTSSAPETGLLILDLDEKEKHHYAQQGEFILKTQRQKC
jgi:hypothetical protein